MHADGRGASSLPMEEGSDVGRDDGQLPTPTEDVGGAAWRTPAGSIGRPFAVTTALRRVNDDRAGSGVLRSRI